MIFYTQETYLALGLASVPALFSFYLFIYSGHKKWALGFLILSAFFLRLVVISLDPFLQEWDERFHALVAKNMMENPFVPMLRTDPVLSYDYKTWCCNHIWVHKQPLFLWQMAVSMKIFGVNEIAMRLPSAIMGTVMVFFTYQVGRFWTKNAITGYIAAFLMTFSFYQLELTSGRFSLDHNDLGFTFYVTASIWALIKYFRSDLKSIKWLIIIGLFTGCAILIKWLTAFVVFGGWGLYILQRKLLRSQPKYYIHILIVLLVTCIVFIPWQVYIMDAFPMESSWMYQSNRNHIFEVLDGQEGGVFYHIKFMQTQYGKFLIPFIIIGIVASFFDRKIDTKITVSFLAIIIVLVGFFSLIVATKMEAFTYPVNCLLLIFLSIGLMSIVDYLAQINIFLDKKWGLTSLLILLGVYSLKPWNIANHRSINNELRNVKIHNTKIYKSLDEIKLAEKIILNVKQFEDVELMFYKNINAYQWYPKKVELDSLQSLGYKFVTFDNHGSQILPDYIYNNDNIEKLSYNLK